MLDMFLNPGYLAAGAALVSLPIIIHLINRMRYKRVRWAAMEFLLRSQKRNRRRLIIEQLILLALRCLLVLLAVLLVSRYLGFSFAFFEPQNTLHIVLLDDTLSMSDQWREDGETLNTFQVAKDQIVKEIAKNAALARTAQRLVLLTLSDTLTQRFDQRLNDNSTLELEKVLADTNCTMLRVDLAHGIEAAKAIFDKNPQDRRLLHLVSDFRQRDWSEPEAEALTRSLQELSRAGVVLNFIDAAHPYRSELQKTPLFHDNLAIVELRPETRVAARDMPVQFTVTVANFGASERKNLRVALKVNGGDRLEGDVAVTVPPGGTKTETLQLSFNQLGFNQVSANIENEETGLQGDNIRYGVIDIRNQVPVLIVDGDLSNGVKPGGDTFHIQTLLTAARGYRVVPRGSAELEQPNLDQYVSIYLLNVREFSEKALHNLENFVREGGSVAFFLGERVNPQFYTQRVYAAGKGIFPAPLADKPYPALADPELEPNLLDGQLKLFVRAENHPIFADVWQPRLRTVFNYLPIKRYFPVPRRQWNREPGRVEELVTLPNHRSIRDYAGEAQALVNRLNAVIEDPRYEKYRAALQRHQRAIHDTLVGEKALYELANALDALLKDRGDGKDSGEQPNLTEFWDQSEYQTLRGRIDKFRQDVQLGDPLVISEQFGKGRIVAFLTTAGRAWADWAGGSPASMTYPVVMLELQKYLTSVAQEANLTVGTPVEIQLDGARYDPMMHRFYVPESGETTGAPGENKATGPVDLKEQVGAVNTGRISFVFDEARRPGLFLLEFTRRGDEGSAPTAARPEQRAFIFNVDTSESDLHRAAQEDLERLAGGVKLRTPGSGWANELANRQNDLSESAWLYLFILAILVIEQALAVHLSFHVKDGGQGRPTRSVVPQSSAA
jgi:hypothetical protein